MPSYTPIQCCRCKFRVFTVILLLAFSCKNSKNGYISPGNPIVIKLDSNTKHHSLASSIDSLCAISLETVDSSVISDASSVTRIVRKGNRIFVLDDKFAAVKVFDSTGKYLFSLGKLGLGKGEFLRIEDIQYYSSHNSLLVLSSRPSKLSEFALDGALIRDSELDFWATGFALLPENSRLFYVNQDKSEISGGENILVTNSANEVESKLFDMPKNISTVVKISGGLYSTGGNIYFNPAFSNNYYLMSGDSAKTAFKIDYGPKNIPIDAREDNIYRALDKFGFQFDTFIKLKDFIGFNYNDRQMASAFVNIHSGDILTSDVRNDSLNVIFSNSMFECDGKLFMILDLNRLSGFLERNSKLIEKRFPRVFSETKAGKIHQNPILLTFTIKSA
jgi:hypothetical protein